MSRVYCLSLVFAVGCFAVNNSVQTPGDPKFAHMRADYDKQVEIVDGWSSKASQQIALAVAIGVFGLLVGALQGTTKAWARPLTVCLGILVSMLTLLTKTVYPADSRTLERSGLIARSKLNDLLQILDSYDAAAQPIAQIQIEAAYFAKSAEIDQIGQGMLGIDAGPTRSQPKSRGGLFEVTVVYAQSKPVRPGWVSSGTQADKLGTFFVGDAVAGSLDQAKDWSLDDAVRKAAGTLVPPKNRGSAIPEKLLTIVKGSCETVDTWFNVEKGQGTFHYFTRLRMTNELKSLDLSVLFPAPGVAACVPSRIDEGWLTHLVVGVSHLYVYLESQMKSTPDVAEVYVLAAESWPGEPLPPSATRKIGYEAFRSQVNKMSASSYAKGAVRNNKELTFVLGGKSYQVKAETHFLKRFAVVTLCPAV